MYLFCRFPVFELLFCGAVQHIPVFRQYEKNIHGANWIPIRTMVYLNGAPEEYRITVTMKFSTDSASSIPRRPAGD